MSNTSFKEEARRLIDGLPDDVTWEDVQYAIYVRLEIAAGAKDSEQKREDPIEEVLRRFHSDPK